MERETCKITVGGVTYTMAEYKKILKEKKETEGKKTKNRDNEKSYMETLVQEHLHFCNKANGL